MVDLVWSERLTTPGRETIKQLALTSLGRHILSGSKKDYKILEPRGRVVIQPDFKASFIRPLRPFIGDLFIKDILSATPEGELLLDFQTYVRVMEMGMEGNDFRSELTRACRGEMPENVSKELDRWVESSRTASIREAYLIEAEDIYLLAEVMNLLGPLAKTAEGREIDLSQVEALKKSAWRSGSYVKCESSNEGSQGLG
jgi:hypothetical protein